MKNKLKWMREKEIQKEKEIVELLNSSLKKSEIAKTLGFKKMTVYIDGEKALGWVCGESLFVKLKDLVEARKKWPLGFDYYYWGDQNYKSEMRDKLKSKEITEEEFYNIFPDACRHCLGSGWNETLNKECIYCKNE